MEQVMEGQQPHFAAEPKMKTNDDYVSRNTIQKLHSVGKATFSQSKGNVRCLRWVYIAPRSAPLRCPVFRCDVGYRKKRDDLARRERENRERKKKEEIETWWR